MPALEPVDALYLKLGGAGGGAERRAGGENADIRKLAEKHFAGLTMLLDAFDHKETPYLSRPFPKFASRFSDYDHLARVKEWAIAGDDEEAGDAP